MKQSQMYTATIDGKASLKKPGRSSRSGESSPPNRQSLYKLDWSEYVLLEELNV